MGANIVLLFAIFTGSSAYYLNNNVGYYGPYRSYEFFHDLCYVLTRRGVVLAGCLLAVHEGRCPATPYCGFCLPRILTCHLECFSDLDCPVNSKCCSHLCYEHQICMPVSPTRTSTESDIETVITTESTPSKPTTEESTAGSTTTQFTTTKSTTRSTTMRATTTRMTTRPTPTKSTSRSTWATRPTEPLTPEGSGYDSDDEGDDDDDDIDVPAQ